jgi:Divergent InlB B-repeat domain
VERAVRTEECHEVRRALGDIAPDFVEERAPLLGGWIDYPVRCVASVCLPVLPILLALAHKECDSSDGALQPLHPRRPNVNESSIESALRISRETVALDLLVKWRGSPVHKGEDDMGHCNASRGHGFRCRAASRSARSLVVALVAVASSAALPAGAHAADTTLRLVPIGLGTVHVTPTPTFGFDANNQPCPLPDLVGTRIDLSGACTLTYPVGTQVMLQATGGDDGDGPPTTFRRWSDDRCPPGSTCTLTLGADAESIGALFSPQRVSVALAGGGAVVSNPSGIAAFGASDCTSAVDDVGDCAGDFDVDLPTPVELKASSQSGWLHSTPDRLFCDSTSADGTSCYVTPRWPRWASVAFGGAEMTVPSIPPNILVNFHIRKAGSGSGTVRGQFLDCGTSCATDRTFGASETLVALPDGDSRFDRWQAACGAAPTCKLEVGPVTAVTAVFEKASAPSSAANKPAAPSSAANKPADSRRALTARVLRLNVRGHGRRRTILIRLQVNVNSTVQARLLRVRRQIASRRWRLQAGSHLMRFRVPRRARPGVYRIRLTISGNGQTERITQRVRVRR